MESESEIKATEPQPSVTVTREHRAEAAHLLGYSPREPFVAEGILRGFAKGSSFESIAESLAIFEARGRAAERADVVAWLDSNSAWGVIGRVERGHHDTHTATTQLAEYIKRGEHASKASP